MSQIIKGNVAAFATIAVKPSLEPSLLLVLAISEKERNKLVIAEIEAAPNNTAYPEKGKLFIRF